MKSTLDDHLPRLMNSTRRLAGVFGSTGSYGSSSPIRVSHKHDRLVPHQILGKNLGDVLEECCGFRRC